MTHTPAPWVLAGLEIHDRPTNHDKAGARIGDTPNAIAQVFPMLTPGVAEANAQLMAASPVLLDALRDLVEDITDRFDMDSPSTNPGLKSAVKRAQAALDAAEGRA